MDNMPQLGTAADLELRAARIADPSIDVKTKHNTAMELREMIDTVRDIESAKVVPHLIPAILEILRSGEAAFQKDSMDYQFRRVLLEILHRIPYGDSVRPQAPSLLSGMMYMLRHDNEENGVTACKIVLDIVRTSRTFTEEFVAEFSDALEEMFRNMEGLVKDVLSEESVSLDANVVLPSSRSFKVISEIGIVVVTLVQVNKDLALQSVEKSLPLCLEYLKLESSAQKNARENYEAMGGYWAGLTPTLKNIHTYSDFIHSQTKIISYMAYIMRMLGQAAAIPYGDPLIRVSLRILQDCPPNAILARKDLITVLRHLMATDHRRALLPDIDKLLDERVLLGTGLGSHESLRAIAYGALADLTHHLRVDLAPVQLAHVANLFSRLIHNPSFSCASHTIFAKALGGLIEVIAAKDSSQGAGKVLKAMLETCADKLAAMTAIQEEVTARVENLRNGDKEGSTITVIEKSRPVGSSTYVMEKPEQVMQELRLLFRALLHDFRIALSAMRKCDAPAPDGTVIFKLFEGCIRCFSLFDTDPREVNELLEWFSGVLVEVNLHVFQEVWTHKIHFYFEASQKRPFLLQICHLLFGRDIVSPTLVAIVLKYLIDRLPELGEDDDATTVVKIRLFKMAFGAVTVHPVFNEPILASHLAKLIMDCFPLAAKATKPTNYFHLLRGLFRAIGGGGGRFELLYKEVLPLLPEMLEHLNRQLLASEGLTRDMIVELCLTVPLRLTHLLPHLTYLMQPLALALHGNPELVSQGLRTLELCIDNLTPDFLDPTLNTVLRELMEALHGHLKPLPASHHHSHTTIRILGKLGGRNRRLLTKDPALDWRPYSEIAKVPVSFSGNLQNIELGPMSILASKTLKKGGAPYRVQAYSFLEACLSVLVQAGIKGNDHKDIFVRSLEGSFDAVHFSETQEQAQSFIRTLSQAVFGTEIRRVSGRETSLRRFPGSLLSAYLDALPYGLARDLPDDAKRAQLLISTIIEELVTMGGQDGITAQDIIPMLHQIAQRFCSLCFEDSWVRKSAGCSGIRIMTGIPDLGAQWIAEREMDLVRTLLHILKDLPFDLPRDIDDVVDVLTRVLKVGNLDVHLVTAEGIPNIHTRLIRLSSVLFSELSSPSPVVRNASQTCIDLLVKLSGRSAHDLLMPHRDRMLSAIYTKPLRALPFPIQIGMIEAVRYCVSLDPPLPELNEELLRLLHETLALADADDSSIIGRAGNVRQGSLDIIRLRVACIKLLTASMPMTDFFSKQPQTRQRVTGVYFKSLYSPNPDMKQVAHEGLRMVLTHQSRLPKELLQTGLRPILMNLADAKRLSVPGLEALARLLELLTNYFKVEIGHKLLDHFRVIADPQMLQASSRLPLAENEGITKLVRLTNIFHLLPSSANIFLDNLVNAIVQTEAQMHFSSRSPFSEPLAKYLDRYSVEAMDFFMRHLQFPRHLHTLRSILQARLAPNLEREVASRTYILVGHTLRGGDLSFILPCLQLFDDLIDLRPTWIFENGYVVDAILDVWRSEAGLPEQTAIIPSEVVQKYSTSMAIFMKILQQDARIDILFDLVLVYTRNLPIDLIQLTHFIYRHVALSEDLIYRRNILLRFLCWFDNESYSWRHKGLFIRYVVIPTLLAPSTGVEGIGLLDQEFIQRLHKSIWKPMSEDGSFSGSDDMFIVELLHLTTVVVQHYSEFLDDVKKDIIKCAWHFITSEDPVVKHTAYLLAARFFEAFDTPQKFILRAWTGLLRPPHLDSRALVRQALDVLAPALPRSSGNESGYPPWAKTTRRLLAEEGNGFSQIIIIYQLIVRQQELFYPVRALFIPHMVNSLFKLGLSGVATDETRLLSVDILQIIFEWEQKATRELREHSTKPNDNSKTEASWVTPLFFRENIVSYLLRLTTSIGNAAARGILPTRALALLQFMLGPDGWNDVTVKLHFFSKALEQADLATETGLPQAVSAAKVLNVVAKDKDDEWYLVNAPVLQKLVQKGMVTDEAVLHDALHPIVTRLLRLYPLPKEEEDQPGEMSGFHSFVYSAVGDGLRNATALRGTLLMLKAVVQVVPERIEPFSISLMKLLGKLTKDHCQSSPNTSTFESSVRALTSILEIGQISVAFLGDQRRWFLSALVALVEKSKSAPLCRFILDLARDWALHKRDPYPTMKEKASLLQKMTAFEYRGDPLFHDYLELIYDIYTESSLRRSDLTSRLEQSFLLGCRVRDASLRDQFMDLLDASVPRSLSSRLSYVLGVQSWDALADHHWIYLALHLLLGTVESETLLHSGRKTAMDTSIVSAIPRQRAHSFTKPIQRLLFLDPRTSHETWVSFFPAAWASLSRREQYDVTQHMITLLSKDYHIKQAELRPNVIQTLLAGIQACSPAMMLPPHLIKYLAKTYGAWYMSLQILEASLEHVRDDEPSVRDAVYDCLADLYAELAEEDLFYGLWRKRSLHQETNKALSFEQNGMWEQAQSVYEHAQLQSRSGTLPFVEAEYCLWEDHWILAAEKLQQWDTLYDLARNEGNQELMLEAAWRNKDWTENRESLEEQINLLPEVATPRRRVFEAFIALLRLPGALDKNVEFTKILEDAMQLSLRKWVSFPTHLSTCHVPLLQHFQQFVELQEAVQIFGSLSTTNAQNLEKKSSDLKMVLQAWRERLPNVHDDISIWSDLVAWRQNVFTAINKTYIPLISNNGQGGSASGSNNTYGYRGYHETAWIINRFAHVARKHDLLDVCFSSLNKIYTLPNIEISEAFLKLREQARCHYQKPSDLQAGLEVINNTNLMYFSQQQKAEFYTLKGMFHARCGRNEEANQAFAQAVQLDMGQAKAWAEWGRFNDRMFKEKPTDMNNAANAVSCYLQAAGMYKNGKSRPLLTRVLWLLSVDDGNLTISRAFDTYKGEAAFWYWITLTPQLCLSISQREVKQARYILLNLAKLYPQGSFFQLRTTREDMLALRKHQAAIAAQRAMQANQAAAANGGHAEQAADAKSDGSGRDASSHMHQDGANGAATGPQRPPGPAPDVIIHPKGSEYIEEIVQILKTAYPLLILTLETMVDQIQQRFKATPEEEIYRLICMLLQDAVSNYMMRIHSAEDDDQLSPQTVNNLMKMAANLSGSARREYEEDFLKSRPTYYEYVRRLQQWRDKYEKYLDSRPKIQPLDILSHWLAEFQYGKFDEIEVPGQYTEEKDSNQNFVRIQKFGSKFENCRSHGYCWRRFTVHGNDNSMTSFSVQLPSGRHCRREERVMQVFRTFNGTLARNKETRKRNLLFHIPIAISCGPSLRLLQSDSSYVAFADIYDRFCEESGITREDPILVALEKLKKVWRDFKGHGHKDRTQPNKGEFFSLKKDILDEVTSKLIPRDVLLQYMIRTMSSPDELWRLRKQFALQVATTAFMTYVFCITSRIPVRFHLSRSTGLIAMSELLPGVATGTPIFSSNDAVPFRFTPNMQEVLGPILTEGILPSGIMAIGRGLTEPEFDLEQQLCLFARDEVMTWLHNRGKPWTIDLTFRQHVATNIHEIVRRADVVACRQEREDVAKNPSNVPQAPVIQTVTNLINMATNPIILAKMGEVFCPWF